MKNIIRITHISHCLAGVESGNNKVTGICHVGADGTSTVIPDNVYVPDKNQFHAIDAIHDLCDQVEAAGNNAAARSREQETGLSVIIAVSCRSSIH